MKALSISSLLLLASCGGCYKFEAAPGWNLPGPGVYFRWDESARPVPLLVSESLSDECIASAEAALLWWRANGIDFVQDPVLVAQSRAHAIREGEITLSAGTPTKESHAGATSQLAQNYQMHSARVTFVQSWCSPRLLAHELGHALGLPDIFEDEGRGNVMYWTLEGNGLQVTDEQLERIK